VKAWFVGLGLIIVACSDSGDSPKSTDVDGGIESPDDDVSLPDASTPDLAGPLYEPGTAPPAPWSAFCVATFTRKSKLANSFGGTELLDVAVGDQYLLQDALPEHTFTVFVPTKGGLMEYTGSVGDDFSFPFETSCDLASPSYYIGAFADVTVFEDEALTHPRCTLASGTIFSTGDGYGRGVGHGFVELDLNSWPAACAGDGTSPDAGSDTGYVALKDRVVALDVLIGPPGVAPTP
jgi:hypothetical protein